MNYRMRCWVLLIASVWMSVRVSLLEGVQDLSIPYPQNNGTRWAVLVAGSMGYANYRHQADVCHAYQILKRGGLKDENIIVFMYDDIAFNPENPYPGIIINKPYGPNVYQGVPKDYTGVAANARNLFAVLNGNRSALTGGSGKVLNSGPDDTVFIYYADHGAAGTVGMPIGGPVYGNDLVNELKYKNAVRSYKKMVIYMEACESGSMFEGILPNDINVYVTTASNARESSYGCYCPQNPPTFEFNTCLGDLYSVSWMEDSDKNDMWKETLESQYEIVRQRTTTSHVMQYGDINMDGDYLATYFGAPANVNDNYNLTNTENGVYSFEALSTPIRLVNQHDAHLLYLNHKLEKAPKGSEEKLKAQKELDIETAHRKHVDNSVHLIGNLLFGKEKSSTMMVYVRPQGQPLVDDWDCLKTFVKTYESYCGALSTYGRKYFRGFANMCNANVSEMEIVAAASQACPKKNRAS